jgi:hypothetical protein
VRANDVRDAEICPWSEGEGEAVSAKRSRSLRREVDWRRAELNSAFYNVYLEDGAGNKEFEDRP